MINFSLVSLDSLFYCLKSTDRTIHFLKIYTYHNGLNLLVHLYRGILKTLRVQTYKFRLVDEV